MSAERIDPATTARLVREFYCTPWASTEAKQKADKHRTLMTWTHNLMHNRDVTLYQYIIRNERLYFLLGWAEWTLDGSTAVQTLATLIEEQQ